jgi:hypothetical protein
MRRRCPWDFDRLTAKLPAATAAPRLTRPYRVRSNVFEIAAGLLKFRVYQPVTEPKKCGDVVTARNQTLPQQRFATGDVLWALGIWSVILCLSPVIVFYMLMVA